MKTKLVNSFLFVLVCAAIIGIGTLLTPASVFEIGTGKTITPFTPLSTPTMPPLDIQLMLEYLTAQHQIFPEQLLIINQESLYYPYSKKSYWSVKFLDNKTEKIYHLLVDVNNNNIVEGIQKAEKAEQEAKRAKYGKIEPALFERLHAMSPEDKIKVCIWVTGETEHSEQERYAILAAEYPEVREALQRSGNPRDIITDNNDLRFDIERRYGQLLAEDIRKLTYPLTKYLTSLGYTVNAFDGIAWVTGELPKAVILELTSRTDVGTIDFLYEEMVP